MVFNPLFISNSSTTNSVDSTKEGKFTNSNYLFADIINVSNEKLSNTENNVELDAKNKLLFGNLKCSDISLSENTVAGTDQFLGDAENLSAFLLNVLGGKDSLTETLPKGKKKNDSTDVSVIPEQIAQLLDILNNEKKISVPLNNNGKNIFVEIQKFDAESINKTSAPKSIKLTTSDSKTTPFLELDFKKIISDISIALKESFNSENISMGDEKIQAIVSKLETAFSNLVTLNNDTFQPQKNILGNLISNIEKEFNLNSSESGELKNIIVSQFTKVVNETYGKQSSQPITTKTNNDITNSKTMLPLNEKEDVESKIVKKVKPEYLLTLKNEKPPESLTIDKKLQVAKKDSGLLKTSIFSSKESDEFTNVKIIPLNEEVKKADIKTSDESNKKGIHRKVNTELKITQTDESQKKSNFDNNTASQNEQNLNNNINTSSEILSKQSTNNEVQNYAEAANKKETLSHKEFTQEVKDSAKEIKINETSLPKASFIDHSIKNQLLNTNEKIIYKNVDIKNIKKEISHLIEKGEKKLVEFQLHPEDLGKVSVKLEVINKIISASIKVETQATQQIIQNSLEGLKTSLNQSGVQFNSLNVSLSDFENKNQRNFKQKRKNNSFAKMNVEGFDENFTHKNLGYNNYDFIA